MTATRWLTAPVHGVIGGLEVSPGQTVAAGQRLLWQEAMKMEVALDAPADGTVLAVRAVVGEVVPEGEPLVQWQAALPPVPWQADGPPAPSAAAVPLVPSRAAVPPVPSQAAAPPVTAPPAEPTQAADDGTGADAARAIGVTGAGDPAAPSGGPGARPPGPLPDPGLRPDLQALLDRQALLRDAARPQAVAQRHARGRWSAREVLAALVDEGSFSEYGAFAVAAQRSRRPLAELQAQTPADGLVCGTAAVDGAPVVVLIYDYTVLAGTQGVFNHQKADRVLELASRLGCAVLLWAEGGGGRPGDVDWLGVAGLDCSTFSRLAALSGQVPLLGVASGWCFAGNAALLGCCDLIIATEGSSVGMGGPAMIEGGGLGVVAPQDVGPVSVLSAAGAVDWRVADDAAAVAALRTALARLRAPGTAWGRAHARSASVPPQAEPAPALRQALPAQRQRAYDPLPVLRAVADEDSLVPLRSDFGPAVITALATLGGQPVALAASDPRHGGAALDAAACDKLARFMQLADVHGLPLITFVDTPGFMVGPQSERQGMVRHAARLFVTAAALRVPVLSVVLRRGFGLGAMALTAGHFHAPLATCAWPAAEFGAMGLEGAVRLGFRKELEAAPAADRQALFEQLLAQARARGQALNMASHLEIDEVIDPAQTRPWLLRHLATTVSRPLPPRRPFLDPW